MKNIYYYLTFIFITLAIINFSCTPAHPDPINTSGTGLLKRFKSYDFTYDNQHRLHSLYGDINAVNPIDTVLFFYANTNTSKVLRIEWLDIQRIKRPIILQYDSHDNLVKVIMKDTVGPNSPLYNDVGYLSTLNPATDFNYEIDSIIYNSLNKPIEKYWGFCGLYSGTEYNFKYIINYFPGDTLIREIKYGSLSSTGTFTEGENLKFDNYMTDHINPLYQNNKDLFLLTSLRFEYTLYLILPIDGLFDNHYSRECDHILGVSKYLPKYVVTTDDVVAGNSAIYRIDYTFDILNRIKNIYRSAYGSSTIDYSRTSDFEYY